jgi:hypothetical protein
MYSITAFNFLLQCPKKPKIYKNEFAFTKSFDYVVSPAGPKTLLYQKFKSNNLILLTKCVVAIITLAKKYTRI